MQLISAKQVFWQKFARKINFDNQHNTNYFVFISVSLLLAKLAGAIATPQMFRHIAYSSLATVIIKRFQRLRLCLI